MKKSSKLLILFITFIIGSICGYIYEELFYLIVDKNLVNSGFLYGPYVPVYGVGAVLMVLLLNRFKKHPALIFVLAMLLTGVLEYITGAGLMKIYNDRWWDYTGLFLNIDGYVCLRSVLSFAVGSIFLIYLIYPFVLKIYKNKYIILSTYTFLFVMLIDFIITIIFRY